jgi:hypothetical protein
MKKMLVAVLMLGVVTFAGVSIASAQGDAALVKVAFPFIVSGKLLPAGSYRIAVQQGDPTLLMITSTDRTGTAAFTETEWAGAPEVAQRSDVHVSFKAVDGHYFLSQVSMPYQDTRLIRLTKAAAEQVLVKLNLMPAEHADVAK